MDISSYISELLFEHDCVVIPNFGGFICNYRSADIHPVQNTISPPTKAVSFNRNLQSNDGLLVSHIAKMQGLSYDSALNSINSWVVASQNLLKRNEELVLSKIGRFTTDVEGNLQFFPAGDVNYLRTAYGLRTITVIPVTRERQIEFTEKFVAETKVHSSPKRVWSIAASVLLIISLVALAELMWMGAEIKPLNLNEAGIFGFLTSPAKPELKPIPVESEVIPVVEAPAAVTETSNSAVVAEGVSEANTTNTTNAPTYYIIIGAFKQDKNIEAAREQLQQKYPDSVILVEKGTRLTRLGYSVGHDLNAAQQQLTAAKDSQPDYWLMTK